MFLQICIPQFSIIKLVTLLIFQLRFSQAFSYNLILSRSSLHHPTDSCLKRDKVMLTNQHNVRRTFSLLRKKEKKLKSFSHVRLLAAPWTVARQTPPSIEFSRQDYWSGLPFPSPGDLPDPGIEPRYSAMQAVALPSEPPGKPFSLLTHIKY